MKRRGPVCRAASRNVLAIPVPSQPNSYLFPFRGPPAGRDGSAGRGAGREAGPSRGVERGPADGLTDRGTDGRGCARGVAAGGLNDRGTDGRGVARGATGRLRGFGTDTGGRGAAGLAP